MFPGRPGRDPGRRLSPVSADFRTAGGVGIELGASIAAFDATDFDRVASFGALAGPVDHVLVAGGYDGAVDARLLLPVNAGRKAKGKVRPGGTVLLMGGAEGGYAALTKRLALELAPVRVNVIALAVQLMANTAVTGDVFRYPNVNE